MIVRDTAKLHLRRLRAAIRKRRLVFALSTAIFAAICLTIVSVSIYNIGGFYRYDLSRPGFEKIRQEISTTPTDVTYDTTSPLSKEAVDSFFKEFDTHRKNLSDYDTFSNGGLDDEQLQLSGQTTNTQQ
jgi:hypothetical protein